MALRKDFINFKDWSISFGPVNKWDWDTDLVPCGQGCTKTLVQILTEPWRTARIKNVTTGEIVTRRVGGKPIRLYSNKERADLIRAVLPYFEDKEE